MFTKYDKAIVAFIVPFIGALVAQVEAGVALSWKLVLLSLGTAVVSSGAVYQAKNKES